MTAAVRSVLADYRVLVVAGGLRDVLPLLGLALVISAIFHDGSVDHLGPIDFSPEVQVMVLVPIILAVACAASHATARTPVIVRNTRVAVARGLSYVTVLIASLTVLAVGAAMGATDTVAASVRNLLLLVGVACATGAWAGVQYAWVPTVVIFGAAVLSPAGSSDWTFYGLLLRSSASAAQLVVTFAICAVGLAVAVWDPRSPGYLRVQH